MESSDRPSSEDRPEIRDLTRKELAAFINFVKAVNDPKRRCGAELAAPRIGEPGDEKRRKEP